MILKNFIINRYLQQSLICVIRGLHRVRPDEGGSEWIGNGVNARLALKRRLKKRNIDDLVFGDFNVLRVKSKHSCVRAQA